MLVTKKLVLATELDGVPPPHQREVLVDLRNCAYVALVVARTPDAGRRIGPVINNRTETDVGERSVARIGNTDDLIPTLAESVVSVALGVALEPRRDVHQRCRRNRRVIVEVVEIVFSC